MCLLEGSALFGGAGPDPNWDIFEFYTSWGLEITCWDDLMMILHVFPGESKQHKVLKLKSKRAISEIISNVHRKNEGQSKQIQHILS